MFRRIFLVYLLGVLTTARAYAQLDPLNQSLLGTPSQEADQSSLKSGRYQIKNEEEVGINLKKKSKTPALQEEVPPPAELNKAKPTGSSEKINQALFEKDDLKIQRSEAEKPAEEPSMVEQVVDLVAGNPNENIQEYIEKVHPDDIRMNQLEIEIGGGLLANESNSNYSFRDYSATSPMLYLNAQVWLTPFVGPFIRASSSMAADIKGDVATNSTLSLKHEISEIGIDLRKFFGLSRKANYFEYGLHYLDSKTITPSDNNFRPKLNSSGFGLHVLSKLPSTPTLTWVLGGKFIPRLNHTEMPTGLTLKSGTSVDSSRIELNLGAELKMNRESQIIWNMGYAFEKQQFSGPASTIDQVTGLTPSGVSVKNSYLLFTLGYRWGQ